MALQSTILDFALISLRSTQKWHGSLALETIGITCNYHSHCVRTSTYSTCSHYLALFAVVMWSKGPSLPLRTGHHRRVAKQSRRPGGPVPDCIAATCNRFAVLAVLAVLMCLLVHISRIILFVYVCVRFHQISTLSKRVMFFALCWLFVAGFITHQLYIYIYITAATILRLPSSLLHTL